MHKQRLLILADHIRRQEYSPNWAIPEHRTCDVAKIRLNHAANKGLQGFRVDVWHADMDCGTVGCIAAHACYLWGHELCKYDGTESIREAAKDLLDLSKYIAMELFVPPFGNLVGITPNRTAAVLRLVADGTHPREAWNLTGYLDRR